MTGQPIAIQAHHPIDCLEQAANVLDMLYAAISGSGDPGLLPGAEESTARDGLCTVIASTKAAVKSATAEISKILENSVDIETVAEGVPVHALRDERARKIWRWGFENGLAYVRKSPGALHQPPLAVADRHETPQ